MNTLQVIITGKFANNFIAKYGYPKQTAFKVVRLCFENGKVNQFSIKIPKQRTGFKHDTIADFAGKEGSIIGMFDLTI
jgi:hypothetical protein